jgi:hypothetical protein
MPGHGFVVAHCFEAKAFIYHQRDSHNSQVCRTLLLEAEYVHNPTDKIMLVCKKYHIKLKL